MLYISDLAVDDSDDLIIENGDFILEDDGYKSSIQVAERRANAKCDTFLLDDINAGLERLINQNIELSKPEIIYELTRVLMANGLFSSNDFEIKVNTDKETKTLQVFVKIKSQDTDSEGFRVIIDSILNQNSYR
jgi:hypothetical protein